MQQAVVALVPVSRVVVVVVGIGIADRVGRAAVVGAVAVVVVVVEAVVASCDSVDIAGLVVAVVVVVVVAVVVVVVVGPADKIGALIAAVAREVGVGVEVDTVGFDTVGIAVGRGIVGLVGLVASVALVGIEAA